MLPYLCFAEINILSLDLKRASVRHCVACIHSEVKDRLIKLAAVDFYLSKSRFDLELQRDRGAEQAVQHLSDFCQDDTEIQDLRLQNLFAAERQQLACE